MLKKPNKSSLFPVLLLAGGIILIVSSVLWMIDPFTPSSTAVSTSPSDENSNEEVPRVSLADAKAAFDIKSAVFVDVRGAEFFAEGHIPSALSIPSQDMQNRLKELNPADWIITYCT
jgi:3-mercaptopyruvate sulfurtransferase SseA